MSLPVEVKIDVILHATEDSKKIFEALFDNFGLIKEDFIVQNLTGHFDNPITFLSINLKKKNAEMFLVKFFQRYRFAARILPTLILHRSKATGLAPPTAAARRPAVATARLLRECTRPRCLLRASACHVELAKDAQRFRPHTGAG